MADNRALVEILDEQRKTALVDRLKSLSAMVGEMEGVSFVTARDIEEVFDGEFEADYDHRFVAETPAHGLVDLVCPQCHQVIPDVPVELIAVVSKEGDGPSKVKVKGKAGAKVHVCGQVSIPRPEPEVEGQVEAFTEEDSAAEADAIERLEGAEGLDDDLLP